MATIDIKTLWDGASYELEDVDLEQITNRDLIQQMIDAGVILPEIKLPTNVKYSTLDKNWQPTSNEVKTLAELGYCNGDTVRIVLPGFGN